jgi:nitrite reductase (NO-forming)
VRIAFGLIWAINASFKWLPGFIKGQSLDHQFAIHDNVQTPVIHQWISAWHDVASASPMSFAIGSAVIESLIALALIFGIFSNVVLIGSAIYSFGIWSGAEAFGLPWNAPGITDIGPSVGYIIASLALFCAAAGSIWSVDRILRPKLGKYGWLTSRALVTVERSDNSPTAQSG